MEGECRAKQAGIHRKGQPRSDRAHPEGGNESCGRTAGLERGDPGGDLLLGLGHSASADLGCSGWNTGNETSLPAVPRCHTELTAHPAYLQRDKVCLSPETGLCNTPQRALPRAGRLWKQGRVAGLGRKGVRQLWGRILRKWEQAGRADFAHPGKQTAWITPKQSLTAPCLTATACRTLNFCVFILGQTH